MMAVRRLVQLNTGRWMPTLGLGTYLVPKAAVCQDMVDKGLDIGYRHIDTAVSYLNEGAIGEVLNERFASGRLKREEVFITTKVPPVYLSPPDVAECCRRSLEQLRLSYVDMLLIHAPFGRRNRGDGELKPTKADGSPDHVHHDLVEAWRALERLVDEGAARAIGVSNFTVGQLERVWESARVKPANVQLECHCYCQQEQLRRVCGDLGVLLTAYAPLGAPGRPAHMRHPGDTELLQDGTLAKVAVKHGRSPGQVCLRFLLQLGLVPLVKSTSTKRLKENMAAYDFELDADDMRTLRALNRDRKYFRFLQEAEHPEFHNNELF